MMPMFGWNKRNDEERQRREPAAALPPPDPSVHELERLLEQAKVGSHEFSYAGHRKSHEEQDVGGTMLHMPADNGATECEEVAVNVQDCTSYLSDQPGSGILADESPLATTVDETEPEENIAWQPAAAQDLVAVESKTEQQPATTLAVFRATPKLNFFTDDEAIPVQLHNLQQLSSRSRHEFHSAVHDLDVKVAELTAKLAEESMDLDLDLRHAAATSVYKPVEAAFECLTLERFAGSSMSSLPQHWMTLEKRLSALDSHMTHSLHVQLDDLKRARLTSLRDDLDQSVEPARLADGVVSDQRETALARRWESLAGTLARRLAEERAARVAAVAGADAALNAQRDPHRDALRQSVADLWQRLDDERAERAADDAHVTAYIVERTDALKRAILEAYPDPDADEQ